MKSSAKKIELASVDDLFSTEEGRQDAKLEKIQEIPLTELHPFKNHPFKVKDDEAMMETADSIKQYGVLVPAIARPDPEGGYELVAGHRRHRASELAEKETMPVIVRDLDDDAATIIMVDSNLQRESLLPSERAFAYKMKLEAVKHQGARTDLTSRQLGEKSQTSIQKVADQAGESQRQVQRYIRLTELIPELMDMVDESVINFFIQSHYFVKFKFVDFILLQNYEQFNHRKRGINHVLHPRTDRPRQPSRPCFFSARTGRAAYPRRTGIPLETARQFDRPGKQMVQAQPE